MFGFDQGEDTVAFSSPTLTVPAGGQASVSASVVVDPRTPDGELYGGFIQLVPAGGGNTLTLPYAGYKGDYQAQQVLLPTASGFPWLASLNEKARRSATSRGGLDVQPDGEQLPVLPVPPEHPARQFTVQVENADGST